MERRTEAAWPAPGERWRRSVVDARRGVPCESLAPAAVRDLRVGPGLVEGGVGQRPGERWAASLAVDLLGPSWRARWLAAMEGGERGPQAAPVASGAAADRRAEAVAAAGLDPVPPPGAVRSRCPCAGHAENGWCGHVAALAEAFALCLDEGRLDLLWRLRGLDSDQAPLAVDALAADGSDGRAPPHETVDDRAFWGGDLGVEMPRVEPWQEAPAAVLRLGPLPAARGQAAAVEPILAHYRRVRDAVRALEAAGGGARSAASTRPSAARRASAPPGTSQENGR